MVTRTSEKFLIDANAVITPYLSYYPFDFALKFWEQLETNIKNGAIAVLDLVKVEIENGNDDLSEWIKGISIGSFIDRRDGEILANYAEVLNYVQTSDYYNDKALSKWSKANVADAWLIAVANMQGYTIITFEKPAGSLHPKNPSGNPKIPDVCAEFNVANEDLFYMMRKLDFLLG